MSQHEPLEDLTPKERLTAKIASHPAAGRVLTYLVGVGLGIAVLIVLALVKGDPAEVVPASTP